MLSREPNKYFADPKGTASIEATTSPTRPQTTEQDRIDQVLPSLNEGLPSANQVLPSIREVLPRIVEPLPTNDALPNIIASRPNTEASSTNYEAHIASDASSAINVLASRMARPENIPEEISLNPQSQSEPRNANLASPVTPIDSNTSEGSRPGPITPPVALSGNPTVLPTPEAESNKISRRSAPRVNVSRNMSSGASQAGPGLLTSVMFTDAPATPQAPGPSNPPAPPVHQQGPATGVEPVSAPIAATQVHNPVVDLNRNPVNPGPVPNLQFAPVTPMTPAGMPGSSNIANFPGQYPGSYPSFPVGYPVNFPVGYPMPYPVNSPVGFPYGHPGAFPGNFAGFSPTVPGGFVNPFQVPHNNMQPVNGANNVPNALPNNAPHFNGAPPTHLQHPMMPPPMMQPPMVPPHMMPPPMVQHPMTQPPMVQPPMTQPSMMQPPMGLPPTVQPPMSQQPATQHPAAQAPIPGPSRTQPVERPSFPPYANAPNRPLASGPWVRLPHKEVSIINCSPVVLEGRVKFHKQDFTDYSPPPHPTRPRPASKRVYKKQPQESDWLMNRKRYEARKMSERAAVQKNLATNAAISARRRQQRREVREAKKDGKPLTEGEAKESTVSQGETQEGSGIDSIEETVINPEIVIHIEDSDIYADEEVKVDPSEEAKDASVEEANNAAVKERKEEAADAKNEASDEVMEVDSEEPIEIEVVSTNTDPSDDEIEVISEEVKAHTEEVKENTDKMKEEAAVEAKS